MSNVPEVGGGISPDPDNLPVSADTPHIAAKKVGKQAPRHESEQPDLSGEKTREQRVVESINKKVEEGGNPQEALADALKAMTADSQTTDEQYAKAFAAVTSIGNKESLSEPEENAFIAGFNKGDASQFEQALELTNLSDDAKGRLRSRFAQNATENPEQDSKEGDGERERADRSGRLQMLGGQAEAFGKGIDEKLDAALEKETDPGKKKELKEHKGHLAKRLKHLNEWLNPDDPLKTWATRGGKSLAVVFMAMVLLIILELAMLNKAVGKVGR